MRESAEIAPGAVLGAERYSLERWLGSGGMASVWLAKDELLTRPVAVKLMADTLAFDARYRERFAREARAAASVSHPSIVPVFDYGLHGARPFLVMEYVPGGSLADVLAGRGAVMPDPIEFASELLGALNCVHAAGLVHRDIKPANILLDSGGHARLTDFGIAQPEDSTSLTQTGMVIGSIRYLAPEVAAGERATVAADLYAAGVVLRELSERGPAPGLVELIAALTASSPGERPESAAAALELIATAPRAAGSTATRTRIAPVPAPVPAPAPAPLGMDAGRPVPRVGPRGGATGTRVDGRRRRAVGTPISARHVERPAAHPSGRTTASLAIHVSPRAAALAIGVVVALVVVIVLSASGGGTPPPARAAATAVRPPSASAPLADQLSSLQKVVARAAAP
ncbi:MAG: eukaryotic-like serine/threonine-protein kinase [Solirubrobacteraceae bacterium]|jgi:serine/threonine protein kinase|nr:eukaryotic-like serine/threonine-protein kinase [Solirubrobacteraceae bacterium]